jgi:NADP-dependent 3-hydroxy acid dehydrogenase YdfG
MSADRNAMRPRLAMFTALRTISLGIDLTLRKPILTTTDSPLMAIQDKVVIITGASSGIGAAAARALIARGAYVMLAARREDRLVKLTQDLGDRATYHPTDVCDYQAVCAMVTATIKRFGHLHGLVNNAGLGHMSPMAEAPIEDWHRMVDVNIKGALNAVHATLPHLIESRGHIVNLASVAAHNVYPNSVVYAGTKHFIKVISQGLRLELRDRVRLTNLSPGAVNTEFVEQIHHPELRSQYEKAFAGGLHPDDVGAAIADALDADERMVISELIIRPNQ